MQDKDCERERADQHQQQQGSSGRVCGANQNEHTRAVQRKVRLRADVNKTRRTGNHVIVMSGVPFFFLFLQQLWLATRTSRALSLSPILAHSLAAARGRLLASSRTHIQSHSHRLTLSSITCAAAVLDRRCGKSSHVPDPPFTLHSRHCHVLSPLIARGGERVRKREWGPRTDQCT